MKPRRPVATMRIHGKQLAAALLAAAAAGAGAGPGEPIRPVPLSLHQDPARAALGRRLYHDARLSGNNRVSCASCHDLGKGGADGRARSIGFDGRPTELNAPTVFNAALNFRQFWNGRADTLEAQVGIVVENPVEMGGRWPEVVRRVAADPGYRRDFGASYRDGVTRANIENAIAVFERTLITPRSRFDRYLEGEANAIDAAEKAGYARFQRYGCIACHQGVNVGGNMFQKFGVMGADPSPRGSGGGANLGRYLVTGNADDKRVFKVPSLRNVALTAPYFHDGSAQTLEQAIDVMFNYQLGREGTREDKELIAKFLRTLTAAPQAQP